MYIALEGRVRGNPSPEMSTSSSHPRSQPTGAFHLFLPCSPHGDLLLSTPRSSEPPTSTTQSPSVFSASPQHTPRAGRMGTQSCSDIEQMVLTKGANEFQARCDCTGRAGGQAQQSLLPRKIPETTLLGTGPGSHRPA